MQWMLALAASGVLTACGGGDPSTDEAAQSSSGDAVGRQRPASAAPAGYLEVAGQNSMSADGTVTMYLLDGFAEDKVRKTIVTRNGHLAGAFTTSAYELTGSEFTFRGSSLLVYVNRGKLLKVSLKRSDSQSPHQVSALTDVCGIVDHGAENLPGTDGLVTLRRAPASGGCLGPNLGPLAYVRLGQRATEAPLAFPTGTVVNATIADWRTGKLNGYVATANASTLMYFTGDLSASMPVTGATNVIDPAQLSSDLYLSKRAMYRLKVTDTGAAFAKVHTFSNVVADARWGVSRTADANAVYFTDGPHVYSIDREGSKTLLTTLPASVYDLESTKTHVVFLDSSQSMWSVPKTGGEAKLLHAAGIGESNRLLGVNGNRVFFDQTGVIPRTSRMVLADGSRSSQVIATGTYGRTAIRIWNPTTADGNWKIQGLLFVTDLNHDGSRKSVTHYDIATKRKTVLGKPESADNYFSFNWTTLYGDRPFFLSATRVHGRRTVMDVFVAQPNTAGSLENVTHVLN